MMYAVAWILGALVLTLAHVAMASPPPGYSEVFREDFSGPLSISSSQTFDGSPYYNSTKQCCMSSNEPDHAPAFLYPSYPPGQNWGFPSPFTKLKPNGVELTIQKESGNASSPCVAPILCWVGAEIASMSPDGYGHAWQYGYFEFKIRLPAIPADPCAIWPSIAFYNMPNTTPKFEIDLFEANGGGCTSTNGVYSTETLHDWSAGTSPMVRQWMPSPFDGQWHVYALLWTAQTITTYLDGQQIGVSYTPPDAQTPMYWAIVEGIGAGWSTANSPSPSTMDIDHVAVWQP